VLAGIVGPVCFAVFVVIQGVLQPDYNHVRMPISALTAYDTGWIQILNFYMMGALTATFALSLHAVVGPARRGVAGVALLMLSGVGIILAGVFPWIMVNGVPTETPAHVVGAVTAFASTGLGFIVFSRRLAADPEWRQFAGYTLATGIVVLVLFVLLGGFAVADGTPLHAWAGLLQLCCAPCGLRA
jgi:hypothetical membrane protein